MVLWDHGLYNKSSAYAQGASMEWHFSFPLMNSFNNTEAAISPLQALHP